MNNTPANKSDKNLSIIGSLKKNLAIVLKGKDSVIDDLVVSILAGVNVLIEDVPGVGKTTLAKGLAKSISAGFRRIQFTPDLLPADILGSSIYNPKEGLFHFKEGPVFTNILLADEINRASPRTQSSLLEAMSEKQVTIDGVSYPLSSFFMVIATQNPIEFHGTYPLPEAQLDRFGISLEIGYPDAENEIEVFYSQNTAHPLESLEPAADLENMIHLQEQVKKIKVSKPVAQYIVKIAESSRKHPDLKLGISTRGALLMYRLVQSKAFTEGREFATPDDVKSMAVKVLAHRIVPDTKARYSGITKKQIIEDIIAKEPVPT
ncbi:MAG: MoxR family ATPase [Firmicutes bacterium]|nr:MoxR family ATPase [Bacillota bacterium]